MDVTLLCELLSGQLFLNSKNGASESGVSTGTVFSTDDTTENIGIGALKTRYCKLS